MAKTHEQRAAREYLESVAQGLRVTTDAEGWPVMLGRKGHIEYHEEGSLVVYCPRSRLHEKILAIPGVRQHQRGDYELRALFAPSVLPQVAQIIRARRKRVVTLTPEQSQERGERLRRARALRGANPLVQTS